MCATKTRLMLFLKCYEARKDEFAHPRLKKRAYSNVLEDMVFQGCDDATLNEMSLANKMRTLLAAYKTAKDACGRTGASATIVPYMDIMDDIFGKNATISNTHSLNLGSASMAIPRAVSATAAISTTPSPPAAINRTPSPPAAINRTPSPPVESCRKRRKTAKDLYYEEKRAGLQRRDSALQAMLAAKVRQVDAEERRNDLLSQLLEHLI